MNNVEFKVKKFKGSNLKNGFVPSDTTLKFYCDVPFNGGNATLSGLGRTI